MRARAVDESKDPTLTNRGWGTRKFRGEERRVAPTALGFFGFYFPALPGGANLCRASRAEAWMRLPI
jgi:hypothetical protein